MLVLLLGICLFSASLAIDTVIWNVETPPSEFKFQQLLDYASPDSPLVVALADSFTLAEFSKLANVYAGAEKSKIPGILGSITKSSGYAAEWTDEDVADLTDKAKHLLHYTSSEDDSKLHKVSVILIEAPTVLELDKTVASVISQLKSKPYVAVLSGKEDGEELHRIAKRAAEEKDKILPVKGSNCIAYLAGVTIYRPNTTGPIWSSISVNTSKIEVKCDNKTAQFTFTLIGNYKLLMVLTKNNDRSYEMTGLNLTDSSGTVHAMTSLWLNPIYTVEGFSYACGNSEAYWSQSPSGPTDADKRKAWGVSFRNLQVQAFNSKVDKFTDNVDDCVPFFSSAIWMGLFIMLILLLILLFGLVMVTSIQTMDRFDDPKGRPLQINIKE